MNQAFQVTKTEAPAQWAAVAGAYLGWVELIDEEGNKAVGAVEKTGVITIPHGGSFSGYTVTFNDCAETCKAARALFA